MTSIKKQIFIHLSSCKHGENQKEMPDFSRAEDI